VIEKLKGLKFDLSLFREDAWQGRRVYVVGAKPAICTRRNSGSIRRICISCACCGQPAATGRKPRRHNSTSTRNSAAAGCREVIFMVDGKTVTIEEYSGLRADMPLDPKLFDPQFFPTVH
jgi:hypothetical protein